MSEYEDDATDLPVTSIYSAYQWKCDDPNFGCGATHFGTPEVHKWKDGEEQEEVYRHFNELEPWSPLPERWEQFEVVGVPRKITCPNCGKEYTTSEEE